MPRGVDRCRFDLRLAEGGAGDEVSGEEERDPEDQHEDGGGPPVGAEPAFPIVQDSTNLREIAPIMDRLYRHCRESTGGRGLPMECPAKSLLERTPKARARWA